MFRAVNSCGVVEDNKSFRKRTFPDFDETSDYATVVLEDCDYAFGILGLCSCVRGMNFIFKNHAGTKISEL